MILNDFDHDNDEANNDVVEAVMEGDLNFS